MAIPNFDSSEENVQEPGGLDLEDKIRDIWIAEVRRHNQVNTGKPSNYLPGPRLDGGVDSHGAKFKPLWPKVAAFVAKHSLDPINFIKAQFSKGLPPTSPSMLLGDRAISRYKQFVGNKELDKDIKLAKEIQTRQIKDSLEYYLRLYSFDTKAAYKALLLDDRISIGPLMKYCLAKSIGEDDIATAYLEPAAWVYLEAPAVYDEVYKELITEELRTKASMHR